MSVFVRVETTIAVEIVRRPGVTVRGPAALSSATVSSPTSALPVELACPSVHDRVQRTAVTSRTIMSGDFPADLHDVVRRGTIGDIFKV